MKDVERINRLMLAGERQIDHCLYSKAALCFQRILMSQPENALAHFGLGRSFFGLEQFADARLVFDYAIQLSPKNPRFQRWLGMTLTILERLVEAEAAFKRAADLEPNRKVVVPFEGRTA